MALLSWMYSIHIQCAFLKNPRAKHSKCNLSRNRMDFVGCELRTTDAHFVIHQFAICDSLVATISLLFTMKLFGGCAMHPMQRARSASQSLADGKPFCLRVYLFCYALNEWISWLLALTIHGVYPYHETQLTHSLYEIMCESVRLVGCFGKKKWIILK